MVDEKDCLMLCYIAEEQSMKRAAERLYITQPALTYRLNQLEKEFAVPLIVRGNRGTKLTMEGERLVEYAKRNLRELTELKEAVIGYRRFLKALKIFILTCNFQSPADSVRKSMRCCAGMKFIWVLSAMITLGLRESIFFMRSISA
jgi:DNA-binding transcriptional LysR family regulator